MDESCLFKAIYKDGCSKNTQNLQSNNSQDRRKKIIQISPNLGYNIHDHIKSNVEGHNQKIMYHKSCVSKYLLQKKSLNKSNKN